MSGAREFEIVPNVSEGRDAGVIDACAAAMEAEGVRVVHRTSDPVHHRSVITAVGSESQVVAASVALARAAHERIDLRVHRGAHPRIGAAFQAMYAEIMFAPGQLDRREREMIAGVAAAAQFCHY